MQIAVGWNKNLRIVQAIRTTLHIYMSLFKRPKCNKVRKFRQPCIPYWSPIISPIKSNCDCSGWANQLMLSPLKQFSHLFGLIKPEGVIYKIHIQTFKSLWRPLLKANFDKIISKQIQFYLTWRQRKWYGHPLKVVSYVAFE